MDREKIAVIPGDGIGREVIPEGPRTRDMEGSAGAAEVGEAIADAP